ncbi:hypothetical protein HY025_02465 [Candidatus Daviesbacteria bacterium]|nr:hypothetical protein [Candidatus Daviesbacteria bacterium]
MAFESVFESEGLESQALHQTAAILVPWVKQERSDPAVMMNWLEGRDLPLLGLKDEPWQVVGLVLDHPDYPIVECCTRIAEVLGERIDLKPDIAVPEGYSNRMLFNLLQLAGAIAWGEILNSPIDRLFQRRSLQGEYGQSDGQVQDLKATLRGAMVYNQVDNKWQKDWERMLMGEHDFLPGGVEEGFLGIRTMPDPKMRTKGGPGPYVDVCGNAFRLLAEFYGLRPARIDDFASQISRYTEYWGTRPSTEFELLDQAAKRQWPSWTHHSMNLVFGNPNAHFAN